MITTAPRFSETPGLAPVRQAEPTTRERAWRWCFSQQLRATQLYPIVAAGHHGVEAHYTGEFTITNSCLSGLALLKTSGYRFDDARLSMTPSSLPRYGVSGIPRPVQSATRPTARSASQRQLVSLHANRTSPSICSGSHPYFANDRVRYWRL